MIDVLITIDTELSAGLHQRGFTPAQNVASSIEGRVGEHRFGVDWQMDEMDAAGLKGVFFVDPLPALVYGSDILPEILAPILRRGHEVQLHIHTEWLQWASQSPVGDRRGRNIGDFSVDDQVTLLAIAAKLLEQAGTPRPIAFRAGNFGADDRTIAALSRLGILWDSSVNPGAPDGSCRIRSGGTGYSPYRLGSVVELPIAGLYDRPGHYRPAQVCALSSWEMRAALRHAASGDDPFTIVTHSFEMLSRDRLRPNRTVIDRFKRMCGEIASHPGLRSAGFRDLDPAIAAEAKPPRLLRSNPARTLGRMVEQAVATALYERPKA